jgi:branched-chain amino acid aminotransferase
MRESSAYLNGAWIPSSDLHVSVDDVGFLVGATVTERLRTFGGRVFRLEEHLARLRNSLEIVGLDADSLTRQVEAAIPEFVRRNAGLIDAGDDWSIAVFATPGRGDGPTICVHGNPLPFHLWAAKFESGVSVAVSTVRQIPPNSLPPQLKCRSRMHYYLADLEAAARQPGSRAILLDQNGFIAEATTANVVLYRRGEGLLSPPTQYILSGVSLGVVQELAQKLELPFVTRRLSVDDFYTADEAFLTSTSICALAVVECDKRPIGGGRPGPVYQSLLQAWNDLTGIDIAQQARRYTERN